MMPTPDSKELHDRRTKLVEQKFQLQSQLSAINEEFKMRLDTVKFVLLRRRRSKLTKALNCVEMEFASVNRQLHATHEQEHSEKYAALPNNPFRRTVIEMIREVRDKWQELSCDETLLNSTQRTQASQFVRDLNPILRKLVNE